MGTTSEQAPVPERTDAATGEGPARRSVDALHGEITAHAAPHAADVAPGRARGHRTFGGALARIASAARFSMPLVVLLLAWAAIVPLLHVDPKVFPSVPAVARAGADAIADGSLWAHVAASLGRVAVGTTLAIALAVPLGVLMGVSPAVSAWLAPPLRFFSVLAGIAWIPIATLWFGYGFGAITFVIFNAVFFVVTYNTVLGVSTIPMSLRHAAASLGAGRRALFLEVLLPGALPNIVTGVRTGLGFAWRGLIAAEMIATNVGLGYMLFVARDFYRTEVIVFGMIVIGLLWLLIDRWLLAPLERATFERWGPARHA